MTPTPPANLEAMTRRTPPSAFARIASSSAAGVAPPNDPRCGENSPLWSPTTVTNSSVIFDADAKK
jgi:hypothetical protein